MVFKVLRDSKAQLEFSESIEFQDNLMELINEKRYSNERIIDLHMYSETFRLMDENLEDWRLSTISSTLFEFELVYIDVLNVSSGYQKDQLFIDVNLSNYLKKNENQLPRKILVKNIPAQYASKDDQEEVEYQKDATTSAGSTTLGCSIFSYASSTTLNQIWGMINAL